MFTCNGCRSFFAAKIPMMKKFLNEKFANFIMVNFIKKQVL